MTISDRTRVQFKLEPPADWPPSEQFPALQFGHVRNSFAGGMHAATVGRDGQQRDMYVIELDNGAVAFTDERSFVVNPPARVQLFPLRSRKTPWPAVDFVEVARHEGQVGALPPADTSDPMYAPLRIIADLHGAYGDGITCDMRYFETGQPWAGDPERWVVRLEQQGPHVIGGRSTLDVTFFVAADATYLRWSDAGSTSDRDQQAGGYQGRLWAVEAVRVWLHQHGRRRD